MEYTFKLIKGKLGRSEHVIDYQLDHCSRLKSSMPFKTHLSQNNLSKTQPHIKNEDVI